MPSGEVGIIRVRSPAMATTIYGESERTAGDELKAGCAYPGDIGALSDGFLRLFARTSDLIIRVGANVECRKARRSRPLWSPRPI
jgi:acyl-CoA synthetase (AMP-forming)/AMP-acid ligase II